MLHKGDCGTYVYVRCIENVTFPQCNMFRLEERKRIFKSTYSMDLSLLFSVIRNIRRVFAKFEFFFWKSVECFDESAKPYCNQTKLNQKKVKIYGYIW